GDRIVVLADGRIQQIGRPIELYLSPTNRFVAGFIGTPAMNFLLGTLEHDNGQTYFAAAGARLRVREGITQPLAGGPITLGIRPEDLRLSSTGHEGPPEPADTSALKGRVVLVERLGGTSHVHFEVGLHRLLASVASDSLPEVGDTITVRVPASRVHLFGGEGRVILATV
ncbi:MAG TPA: TOBE domain-containing protein, partial [Gemmatimonadaceae bacterium]|nr:TOBE domain-containing protein [Gemmatimonadaceae bacterium]